MLKIQRIAFPLDNILREKIKAYFGKNASETKGTQQQQQSDALTRFVGENRDKLNKSFQATNTFITKLITKTSQKVKPARLE